MKTFDIPNLDTILGTSHVDSSFRSMHDAQNALALSFDHINTIANQVRRLHETDSLAMQMVNQLKDMEKQRLARIKKILDPLSEIRNSLIFDTNTKRMLEHLIQPKLVRVELNKLLESASYFETAGKFMQDSMRLSISRAKDALAAASITSSFTRVMKTYEDTQKLWVVPPELINSMGALQAMQDQIGKLTLPVIDWPSATTLSKILGSKGLAAQLSELGINSKGTVSKDAKGLGERGIGLSRKQLELMTLLSLILAFLVPIYQEYSSNQSQQQTDKKLETQHLMLENQARTLTALSSLLEQALIKESKRSGERFVVIDRFAVVRKEPKHGSAIVGKLFPNEVVIPISEQGKWIQFEYYHWLMQNHQTGWALKKYFMRIPTASAQENWPD